MKDRFPKSSTQLTPFKGLTTSRELTLERYRQLLCHPVWMAITRITKDIRAYQDGIQGTLILVHFTEVQRSQLSDREYTSNLKTLYNFLLNCYWSCEDWENYIKLWDELRLREDLYYTYALYAERSHVHKKAIGSFILRRTDLLEVHFLYSGTDWRKKAEEYLEKQKLGLDYKKKRRKKKLLTPEEINFRIRRGLLFCERGLMLEQAKEKYLKDEISSTRDLYAAVGKIFSFFDNQYDQLKETREPEYQRPPVKEHRPWSREANETAYAQRVKQKRQDASKRRRSKG